MLVNPNQPSLASVPDSSSRLHYSLSYSATTRFRVPWPVLKGSAIRLVVCFGLPDVNHSPGARTRTQPSPLCSRFLSVLLGVTFRLAPARSSNSVNSDASREVPLSASSIIKITATVGLHRIKLVAYTSSGLALARICSEAEGQCVVQSGREADGRAGARS